jgi:hypothetical protein
MLFLFSGIQRAVLEDEEGDEAEEESGGLEQQTPEAGQKTAFHAGPNDELQDSLFIPLGWTRPCPRTYYKGSDPEWQEFAKLSTDMGRQNWIRGQLSIRHGYGGIQQTNKE